MGGDGADGYGRLVTGYVTALTRHHRKLYALGVTVILGITAVSVVGFKFMIEQTTQSSYDWTVSSSPQSFDRDAVAWARSNRGLSVKKAGESDTLGEVKDERSQKRHFLSLVYMNEDLASKDDMLTAANLQTICEAENQLLAHPDYPAICFKGASPVGYTEKDGDKCARQQLSILSLFYLPWVDDSPAFDKDSPFYAFAGSSDGELAAMQIFGGVPVLYAKHPDAPTSEADLWDGHARKCGALSAEYVQERSAQLIEMLDQSDSARQILGFFLSLNVEKQGRSELTRSNLVVSGAPLPGYDSADDRRGEQRKVYDSIYRDMEADFWAYFGMVNSNTKSAYASRKPIVGGIAGSAAVDAGVDMRYIGPWAEFEFDRMVNADLMWVSGSVAFVYFYILFHTRSVFLACMSMFQIFLSLPLAFFVYRVIGQIDYFVQLHILTIFLVLGVGADDVFVFVDSHKQAKVTAGLDTQLKRMLFTWSHTAQSVLNTSVTTGVAFCSTAITEVMPISSFGIYAAIAIAMNYILTITFFPLVVLMYENDVAACWNCIRRRPREEPVPFGLDAAEPSGTAVAPTAANVAKHAAAAAQGAKATAAGAGETVSAPYATPGEQLRPAERFFRNYYAPLLNWAPTERKWFKPVSLALVCMWAGLGSTGAFYAFKLRPPTKQEQWFTADHMYTGFGDIMSNRFLSGAEDSYVSMELVFGVEGLERSDEYVRWNPSENRGTTIFDETFDVRERKGQQALLRVCEAMRVAECASKSCVGGFKRFAQPDELYCPIEQFDEWYAEAHYNASGTETSSYDGATDRPTGDDFVSKAKDFTKAGYESSRAFGFIEGALRWVEVPFTSTLLNEQPYAITIDYYDAIHATLAAAQAEEDPDGALGVRPFVHAGSTFTWIMTEQALVANVLQGFAICFPVCFVVLIIATGSVRLSLFAIVSIALIVGLTLGFCQAIMGWGLGIAETVCSTIVIGFSVDYVVHLGHSYRESQHHSREGKVSDALTRMGITVIAGAVTTFGSGLFMFACQMTFFTKMATLIVAVVVLAILFALMFFMPLCAIAGPEGEMKSIGAYAHDAFSSRQARQGGAGPVPTIKRSPATANSAPTASDASTASLP